MKKRYLSMLLAVVMCLCFGITGAMAAAEPNGEAIEGYGGTVVYQPFVSTKPDSNVVWKSSAPADVNSNIFSIEGEDDCCGLTLTVASSTSAGAYIFDICDTEGKTTGSGALSVRTAADAKTNGSLTDSSFTVSVLDQDGAPVSGAEFAVYVGDKAIKTYTTDDDGCFTVNASDLTPSMDGTTYTLKQLSAPDGYTLSEEWSWSFKGKAEFTKNDEGCTTGVTLSLTDLNEDSLNILSLVNTRLTYDYAPFDLYAWTADNVTWDGEDYHYEEVMLPGVAFTVYADDTMETQLGSFTTAEDGKVTITADKLGDCPAVGETKSYYLAQTTASVDAVHGARPLPEMGWEIYAEATLADDGNTIIVTLSANDNEYGQTQEDGSFWVYNDRYASVSFDIEKTVSVENKGAEPGENTFDFMVVYGCDEDNAPLLSFTPNGGTTIYPEVSELGNGAYACCFSLSVKDAATVKGAVCFEGWETALEDIGFTEVYEQGDDSDDWTLAECMYVVSAQYYGRDCRFLDTQAVLYRMEQLDKIPEGGGNTGKGELLCNDDGNPLAYRGYNGRWYDLETLKAETVRFVNTYTKAAPTATPSASAKPAQSPKTGDEAMPILWILIVVIAVAAVVVLLIVRKKKTK